MTGFLGAGGLDTQLGVFTHATTYEIPGHWFSSQLAVLIYLVYLTCMRLLPLT